MPWNGAMSSLWNQVKLYKQRLAAANDCFVCAGATRDESGLCEGCVADLPRRAPRLVRSIASVDYALAAYRYEFPVTDMVRAAKFEGDLCALTVLASAFTDEFLAGLDEVDVLLPVPLLPWRFLRRGFNQSAELARHVSARTGLPVRHDIAVRTQLWGRAQSQLNATDRRANVSAGFKVKRAVLGLRIAIIDDVITTGATCAALASALRAAGAVRVVVIAAAATPRNHD